MRGQNIVPYAVSRFRAESLRFQGGFFGPFWFNRVGDVVIADVPEDMNPQPFTLHFKMDPNAEGKLYQYFSLETRDTKTHGIAVSFWYPADGIGPVYAYRYAARGEHPLGVTALRDLVIASRRDYRWEGNIVGEARPYIHEIADAKGVVKRRFLYMVTLVTFTHKEGEDRFTAGAKPDIAMVDANLGRVVWVDVYHPETWDKRIRDELGSAWAQQSSFSSQ